MDRCAGDRPAALRENGKRHRGGVLQANAAGAAAARLGAAAALASSLLLAGCAATSLREGFGEYVEDSFITARIKAGLVAYRDLSAMAINVETFKGRVQLSGFVGSRLQRLEAEALARSTPGVKEVANDIRLR